MGKLPTQFDDADKHFTRAARAFAPVVSRYFANSQQEFFVGSGFLVEVEDRWFWMTADHVFDGMEKLQDYSPKTVFEFLAPTDPTHGPIHFNYDRSCRVSMERSLEMAQEYWKAQGDLAFPLTHLLDGLDIGFMELSDYYRRHFESFEAQPLRKEDLWNGSPEFFDRLVESNQVRFVVMGTPHSSLEIRHGQIKETALKVLDIWPHSVLQPLMRFDAIWRDELHVGSVAGMSGGPAYAVIDDQFYWFGVQSGEFKARDGDTPTALSIALAMTVLRLMVAMENAPANLLDDLNEDQT